MIELGIVLFSMISAMLSFLLIRGYERFEKSELTSYVLLFVWGAFLFGLSLSRFTATVQLASLAR